MNFNLDREFHPGPWISPWTVNFTPHEVHPGQWISPWIVNFTRAVWVWFGMGRVSFGFALGLVGFALPGHMWGFACRVWSGLVGFGRVCPTWSHVRICSVLLFNPRSRTNSRSRVCQHFFCFIPTSHVHKTKWFLEFWFYTKFACPEHTFIFGIAGLYKICMSRKLCFWELWFYAKFACPENQFILFFDLY